MPRNTKVAEYPRTTKLGKALSEFRCGVSSVAIAEYLGIDQTTLTRAECGRMPSLRVARILARWLGWTLDEFAAVVLDDADPPKGR